MKEIRFLLSIISCKKQIVFYTVLAAAGVTGAACTASFIASSLVNWVMNDSGFLLNAFCLGVLFLLSISVFFTARHFAAKAVYNSMTQLREQVIRACLYHDTDKIHKKSLDNYINYLIDDVNNIEKYLTEDVRGLAETVLIFFIMSVVILNISVRIYFVVIAVSLFISVTIFFISKKHSIEEQILKLNDTATNKVIQIYRFLPLLHFLPNSKRLLEEYKEICSSKKSAEKVSQLLTNLCEVIVMLCNVLRVVAVIILGIMVEKLDVGTIVALLNLTSFVSDTSMSLYNSVMAFQKVGISCKRVYLAENTPKEVLEGDAVTSQVKELCLRGIGYTYTQRVPVFNNVSLSVCDGDIVLISGRIGCGKSTLSKILSGLLTQNEGEIYLNGRLCRKDSLRCNVAYLDQKSLILTGTIAENISSFAEKRDDRRIMTLLTQVHLEQWVKELPDGIHTTIFEDSENLSGGQKQRLALARALYKNTSILVLDEPTSALDGANIKELLQLLNMIAKDNHIIIIASHNPLVESIATKKLIMDQEIYHRKTLTPQYN